MTMRHDRLIALGSACLAVIGLVDAAIVGEPDLVVLFAGIAALSAISFARSLASRRCLNIRSDLVVWLQRRADLTGESPEAIADRGLAMFRNQLGEAGGEGLPSVGTTSEQTPGAP